MGRVAIRKLALAIMLALVERCLEPAHIHSGPFESHRVVLDLPNRSRSLEAIYYALISEAKPTLHNGASANFGRPPRRLVKSRSGGGTAYIVSTAGEVQSLGNAPAHVMPTFGVAARGFQQPADSARTSRSKSG
ncbi:MAG: hypothetical protein ABSE80_13985 [Halobacteriota archaeon]|jgi:hypothetical protein